MLLPYEIAEEDFFVIFVLLKLQRMNSMERLFELSDIEIRMGFASSCVEATAKRTGCTYKEMYQRMKRVGLINNFIIRHYDTIHTESRENIIESVLECLENWEKKKGDHSC